MTSEKIALLLYRSVGIILYDYNVKSNGRNKVWLLLTPLPYYFLFFSSLCFALIKHNEVYYVANEVATMTVTDIITISSSIICAASRIFYYFLKRNKFQEFIHEMKKWPDKGTGNHVTFKYLYILIGAMGTDFISFIFNSRKYELNIGLQLTYFLYYFLSFYASCINMIFMDSVCQTLTSYYRQINMKLRAFIECRSTGDVLAKTEELRQKHYQTYTLAKEANGLLGIPVLIALGDAFQEIAMYVYVVLQVLKKDPITLFSHEATSYVPYAVMVNLNVCYLIRMWVKLEEEANKASVYVHNMWNRFAYKAEDINDLLSLQLAALQMLQTKHSFSASGFFPMDMTVLHMLTGSLTTYLVFLIQIPE